MKNTLEPMLAMFNLGGGEIILILVALLFLLASVVTVVFLIVYFLRENKNPASPHSPIPPVHPTSGRHRFKTGLLLLLLAGMAAAVCFLPLTRSQGSVEVLSQSEFVHAFESNRIVSATITYDAPGSSLVDITGTYRRSDQFNHETEARYLVRKALLTEKMQDALLRGKVEIGVRTPNIAMMNLIWSSIPVVMVLLIGLALSAAAFFVIRRVSNRSKAAPTPPGIPQTE
jgi:hypothetical protein